MIFKVGQFDLFGQIILSGSSNQMFVRLFRPSGQRIHRIDHGLGKTLIQEVLQRDGAIFDDIVQDGDELKSRVAKLRQQSQWVKDVGCSLAIGLSLMSLKGDAKCFFKQGWMAFTGHVHGDAWLVGWLPIDPRIRIEAWPGHPP